MNLVLDVDEISSQDLLSLVSGENLAVRYRGFTSMQAASHISSSALLHHSRSVYRNTDELERVGQSHYETHDVNGDVDEDALEEYLQKAPELMAELRAICHPYESPMVRFWRLLSNNFKISPLKINERDTFAGVIRIFSEGKELLPHDDSLRRDAPQISDSVQFDSQFSANIYLATPESGGELQLWRKRLSDHEVEQFRKIDSKYGLDRKYLPPPDLVLKCLPGDLILFNASRVHAVTKIVSGKRISMSCFLGFQQGQPLVLWS